MVGVIGAILGSAGHRIIAAYDGREAIKRFEEEHPDLVLLDLAMPGVDGADVCRRIRAAGDTPIIVVSGESDLGVTVELLDAGADDYVRKPFRAAELLARTRTVVRRRRRAPARDGWIVDRSRHEVAWQDRPIPLTVTEFRLGRPARRPARRGRRPGRPAGLRLAGCRPAGSALAQAPHGAAPIEAHRRRRARPGPDRGVGYRLDDAGGRARARSRGGSRRRAVPTTGRSRAPHPNGHRTRATCNRRVADAPPAQPRTRPPIGLASGWVALAPRPDGSSGARSPLEARVERCAVGSDTDWQRAGIGPLLAILPGTVAAAEGGPRSNRATRPGCWRRPPW